MKDIRETLPELRRERGWSRERLAHSAYAVDREGTSAAQIAAIERGVRRPSARTMAALAEAMEVSPTVFAEYRLALARHVLDERKVGLEQAMMNLETTRLEPIRLEREQIRRYSRQGMRQRRRLLDKS